ncbi:hypothetical protein CC78DRAFT_613235 [Lojkania enalia]|uniref:Uncharacterized protein n=1 Tax=Lojkania enalia TaxID=147567 RepID=A0A9P4KIG4_9PLEO|nr:hypothetical protein CC78DRAFT_613235 [Didymosphaeria enalia]
MSGPPVGFPWLRDVGDNPNINRNPPPPPTYRTCDRHNPCPVFDRLPPGAILINDEPRFYGPPPEFAVPVRDPAPQYVVNPPPAPVPRVPQAPVAFAQTGYQWVGGAMPAAPVPPHPPCDGTFGAVPPPQTDPSVFPGGRLPGVTTFEAGEHTVFCWIKGVDPPWAQPGMPLTVEFVHVESNWTVDDLINKLNNNARDSFGCAITECLESGRGVWGQGTTFVYGTQQSHQKLWEVGWDKTRNRDMHPTLHGMDFQDLLGKNM